MDLEQQLQFPFMIDIEKEEKNQKRIEGYRYMAKAGAILGAGLTLIELTDPDIKVSLMNQAYIALANVGVGSLVFVGGESLINKLEESNFYKRISDKLVYNIIFQTKH